MTHFSLRVYTYSRKGGGEASRMSHFGVTPRAITVEGAKEGRDLKLKNRKGPGSRKQKVTFLIILILKFAKKNDI